MTQLLFLRGVQASGKSTFARKWVNEDPTNRVRINRDDLRFSLFGKYWGVDEFAVTVAQNAILTGFLKAGKDVVLDNTNLKNRDVRSTIQVARKADPFVSIDHLDFPVSYDTAVYRDWERADRGERAVGHEVIASYFSKYISKKGALPEFPKVENPEPPAPYVYTPGLPHCIIVDIDGTLAHMNGKRGPYDTHLYHVDDLDQTIHALVESWFNSMPSYIILLSGRNEDFREATEAWLAEKGVDYDFLYMRPSDQPQVNDAIVKNELFEKYIAGKYNVDFILDDRDRVVDMWRSKGLKVLQVAEGAF